MRKTSYLDLEFMLWKILCATSMPEEIISFTCKNVVNGKKCNNTYDWLYRPAELLDISTIMPAVLEEMKITGDVSSRDDILANYNKSFLNGNDYVLLPSSGYANIYGHASGWESVNFIFPLIKSLTTKENVNNPLSVSKMLRYAALASIKQLLVPDKNTGGWIRVRGATNIAKILVTFDEFDWQTISELSKMVTNPYNFSYSIRGVTCSKCNHKEDVQIDTMIRLLFIVAQSQESVKVTLIQK